MRRLILAALLLWPALASAQGTVTTSYPPGLFSFMYNGLGCTGGQVVRRNVGGTAFECATIGGSGDVVGPASATDNAITRFDTTTGKLIQNSGLLISDANLLQMEGTSSSFPALKRSGTEVQARLADDSGFATFTGILKIPDSASNNYYTLTRSDLAADRNLNLPLLGADDTLATLGMTQTFSSANTFSNFINVTGAAVFGTHSTNDNSIRKLTVLTPDSTPLLAGAISNSWHIYEGGDLSFDFNNGPCGTSACTDPAFIWHSHNQSTTEWGALQHDATDAVISTGAGGLKLSLASDYVELDETAAPATPTAGKVRIYAKNTATAELCAKDDAGTETCMSAGGGSSDPSLYIAYGGL